MACGLNVRFCLSVWVNSTDYCSFQYFESLADTQMLAMLSCVLSEPPQSDDLPQSQRQWDDSIHYNSNLFGTYYPSEVGHEWFGSQPAGSILHSDHPNKPAKHYTNSSIGVAQDALTTHSLIPPISYKQRVAGLERRDSGSSRMSTSPEQLRHEPRLNSNLASAFAASLSRPFSFNSSASSSPPSNYRKRLSPAGSYLGSHSGVGWGTTSLFSRASTRANAAKHGHSISVSDVEDEEGPNRALVFTTKLKNQQQFPEDGYADVPLLDSTKEWLYRAYREAYANILFSWNMPIAVCEVLKYNKAASPGRDGSVEGSLAIGKTTTDGNSLKPSQSLTMKNICQACDIAFVGSGSEKECPKCSARRMPLVCFLCNSIIRGLASPCLSCGHTLHSACRVLLSTQQLSRASSADFVEEEEETCPSGCGCHCSDHAIIEVDEPKHEVRNDNRGSFTVVTDGKNPTGWQDQTDDDDGEHTWQDVVYESLARNLGSRTVTPKSSQIWRGGLNDHPKNRKQSVGSNLRNEESAG